VSLWILDTDCLTLWQNEHPLVKQQVDRVNYQEMRMREPLDEKTMLEILELAKEAEQKARETSELATAIALKYQKRMREIREGRREKVSEIG
jgi:hypothetical protein